MNCGIHASLSYRKNKTHKYKSKVQIDHYKKNHVSYEPLEALYDVYHILYIIKKINKNY